jgi:hypothetical protein
MATIRGARRWGRPVASLGARAGSCTVRGASPLTRQLPTASLQISDYITAHTDTLGHLPEALKRKLAKAESKTINETIEEFSNVALDIVVDVRLVGFDGVGCAACTCTCLCTSDAPPAQLWCRRGG